MFNLFFLRRGDSTVGAEFEEQRAFPSTHWSLVGRAGGEFNVAQRDALNELLCHYWWALKTHLVVRKRFEPNEADDLLQGFIQSKVLEYDLIQAADRKRGRFRNLLLTALGNYVANEMEARGAQKRTAEHAATVDFQQYTPFAASLADPDRAFDLEWARGVLNQALSRMQDECSRSQRMDLWQLLQARVVAPILEGAEPAGYEELVERFGFKSPTQASNALITAKRMFIRALRNIVREYASDTDTIDDEIRELREILASAGPGAVGSSGHTNTRSLQNRDRE